MSGGACVSEVEMGGGACGVESVIAGWFEETGKTTT